MAQLAVSEPIFRLLQRSQFMHCTVKMILNMKETIAEIPQQKLLGTIVPCWEANHVIWIRCHSIVAHLLKYPLLKLFGSARRNASTATEIGGNKMIARLIKSISIGLFVLSFGCNTLGDSPSAKISPEDSKSSDLITREENYIQQDEYRTYTSRNTILFRAAFQWMKSGKDQKDISLSKAISSGLIPVWIIDPGSGDPVHILGSGEPSGSDVILLEELGGLSCKMVPGPNIGFSEAESETINNFEAIQNGLNSMPQENLSAFERRKVEFPPTEWGVMMDGLLWHIRDLAPRYVAAQQKLPSTFKDILGSNYFLVDEFLEYASSLINSGKSSYFECGVIPAENILYFDFDRQEPMGYPVSIEFTITDDGFDLYNRNNLKEELWPDGFIHDGYKIVLLSDEMLADPDEYFDESVIRPLSDFYIPE